MSDRPDATPCELPGHRPTVPPKHASVWIRIAGAWRHGEVMSCYWLGDQWAAWLQHEDLEGGPWATWGAFIYDTKTFQRRDDETRPE